MIAFLVCIFAAFVSMYLGLKGKRKKEERELDTKNQELLGAYEGAVQDYWWFFLIVAFVPFIVGIFELVKYLVS